MADAPLVRARLYPEKVAPPKAGYAGPLHPTKFVGVQVWPTRAALRAHLARWGFSERYAHTTEAQCTDLATHPKLARTWAKGAVAEVNLHRGSLGSEIVAHEFFHAAIAWGRMCGIQTIDGPREERLAYVHGDLVRAFVRLAYAEGLRD